MTASFHTSSILCKALFFAFFAFWILPNEEVVAASNSGITRHYYFDIQMQNVTRLCHTKSLVTVNGQFPGPRIVAREGDRLVIKVVNHVSNNITIHWHGIRQLQSGWADGPAYVTQCPIQTGQTYVYNFTITGQRGTLLWHAHISWLRATVYGPIIILPKLNVPYPFTKPYKEVPIIFGEWFNADTEAIISQALQTGGGPNVSDAYTINGLPGPLYNCSVKDTFRLIVKPGKTYLLRLINAALNDELFFSIANHTLTIVDADAVYIKPFNTKTLLITPGQTTNVLLKTKSHAPNATFLMAARPYFTGQGTFDNSTTTGILQYESLSSSLSSANNHPLFRPNLPSLNNTSFAAKFSKKFRSLATTQFPANVPKNVDKHFFFTVGLGTSPCPKNHTCQGPNGSMFAASINNISFALPTTALLQSHFFGQSNGVYATNFPSSPIIPFNYTGTPPNNTLVINGTKVVVLPFNTSVELVMQDTSILGAESHPLHLHGFNFFVIGQGSGNYNPTKDPAKFNLIDPVERNTIGVPSGLRVETGASDTRIFRSFAPRNTKALCRIVESISCRYKILEHVYAGIETGIWVWGQVRGREMGASVLALAFTLYTLVLLPELAVANQAGITRHYKFDIKLYNVTRLCHTRSIVAVNGQFPGPRIIAREGDRVVVKVVNHVQNNVTLHWHGIRQLQSGWADGPAYVTQCPIQTGQTYVYNFTITGQRGTLFWHAHISWLRVTVYGPIVILPKRHTTYPFPEPHKEVPIIFGEWFNADPEAIITQALQTGAGPNVSDAYTINGLPGPLYNCSANDTFKLKVKPGKTYLLRLINAALNDELFFSIANHSLTIVDVDAVYVKPFKTNVLLITPGQTTNVLLETKPQFPGATFLMAARPYATGQGTFDNSTTAGILEYESPSNSSVSNQNKKLKLFKPTLPKLNDTAFASNFSKKLRSLANAQFPANVPKTINRQFFFTVGLGTQPCPKNQTCQGPSNTTKFAASVNNVSFVMPTTALLQAHFFQQSNGVYNTTFPTKPLIPFNYTGTPPNNTNVSNGTNVVVLPFNTSVELVMQDTSILGAESHPLHLHGFNFFAVGQGFGNYNPNKDPANFNLVDPVERNTIGVPSGGWVAIRFFADNPGVWFMHCHLEVHTSWGLKMAWVVLDGKLPNQKLPPPPSDLPKC
ncbi:hypothetical protein IFM89_000607 [Coptis chinensis]|uniref:Laccase n=1 Tax=Coptis chinensis TaxID=261450 RepID=A0A835HBN7_9MAGN|nr:hypothetical protein IFM89_000607 [Coptis chinensis]